MSEFSCGRVNGHLVGLAMKEMVRRAIGLIRAERFMFEAHKKETAGKAEDFVTSADKGGQKLYVKLMRESFPTFGIVAEETDLRFECTEPGIEIYFTVDPLDGTKAFMRRQSYGIGTMISLVCNGRVVAAYVGDVMTQEIFGYRPDSCRVHRISEFGKAEELICNHNPLLEQFVLLRDSPEKYSGLVQNMVRCSSRNGLFKGMEISRGSIGVFMARLWKGEAGAVVLLPGRDTLWDKCPVEGISRQMGFVFFANCRAKKGGSGLKEYTPETREECRKHETIIVHGSRRAELLAWREKFMSES